jgi:hypothetical protein
VVDYGSYKFVSATLDRVFENICRDSGLPRSEAEANTYIDITSGTKAFSVAAAIQTLNRRAIFLYATSNSDSEKVSDRPGGHMVLGFYADAQFSIPSGGR